MYKKIIFLIILLKTIFSFSQDKSILIYSEGKGYLQPYIEKTVKNLTEISKYDSYYLFEKEKYFDKVNSLNTYISDINYQGILSDLLFKQKPKGVKLNTYYNIKEKLVRNRIFDVLTEYDYFLVVKTNTLGELIEFQFQLFKTIKSNNNIKNIPFTISDNIISTENIFINPRKENYLDNLNNAIHRLFIKSNNKPTAILKIFNTIIKNGDKIDVPYDRIIELNGKLSGDIDSKNITYHWRNIPNSITKNLQNNFFLSFEQNKSIQKVKINYYGHKIGFKVYDGIQYSDEIIFELETNYNVSKPIYVYDSILNSYNYKSIISTINPKIKYEGKIKFHKYYDGIKILVSNKKIGAKFLKEYYLSRIDSTTRVDNKNKTITIISEFDSDYLITDRLLYVYGITKSNLLTEGTKIIHKLKSREVINFYLKGTVSSITTDEKNESNVNIERQAYFNLGIGAYLTKNIELDFSVPLKTKLIKINNIEFQYPSAINSSIKYHFYSKEFIEDFDSTYFGLLIKSYLMKNEDDESQIKYNSYGLNFGQRGKLLNFKNISIEGSFDLFATKFFGINELDKNYDIGASFGLSFRF